MVEVVFESPSGKVWREGDDYGTLRAGHALCADLAREVVRLRAQLAAAYEDAAEKAFHLVIHGQSDQIPDVLRARGKEVAGG